MWRCSSAWLPRQSFHPIMDFPAQEMIRWGANCGPLTLSGEWWRLLTIRLRPWRPPPHRLQHVVPVESWALLRIALWTLDLCRHLSHLRSGREPGQRGMASRRTQRRRLGSHLRTGWRADRSIQVRRVLGAALRTLWHAAQPCDVCRLQPDFRSCNRHHRQRCTHRRPRHGTDSRCADRGSRSPARS